MVSYSQLCFTCRSDLFEQSAIYPDLAGRSSRKSFVIAACATTCLWNLAFFRPKTPTSSALCYSALFLFTFFIL
jgi:hypothetical protein